MSVRAAGAGAVTIRDATDADVAAITEIYAHHVCTGLGSFEEIPPSRDEIARRRAEVLARDLPYLVAVSATGAVVGYAYASLYRARSAYRFSVEDSVYVAPDSVGRGIGRALLEALIARCGETGYRQMVAVIGDSGNAGSITLHERLGFRRVGLLPAIGYKHGRWVDSVLMQRELGEGAATMP